MKEHPILFNGEMVRQILAWKKTQTRMLVKPQPSIMTMVEPTGNDWCFHRGGTTVHRLRCPYSVGDVLWVREASVVHVGGHARYEADGVWFDIPATEAATEWYRRRLGRGIHTTPSVHMPRWANRIRLEVTDVRAELVDDISREDCIAEGMLAYRSERAAQLACEYQEAIYASPCQLRCRPCRLDLLTWGFRIK